MSGSRVQPSKAIEVLGWHVVTRLDRLLSRAALVHLTSLADTAVGRPRSRRAFEREFLRVLARRCPDVMKLVPADGRGRFTAGVWRAIKNGQLPRPARRGRRVRAVSGVSRRVVRAKPKLDIGYARDRRGLLERQRARRRSR